MFFQTSRGIRLSTFVSFLSLALFVSAQVFAQGPEAVLASVNGREITLKEIDDSVAAQIYPLQQQLYAIRKAALENLITTRILETEAAARGISIEQLRRQLTLSEVNITRAQVEEAYKQNASFFASMSQDEAKERLRLDLETQARMKLYREGLEALRKKLPVQVNLSPPVFVSELDDGTSPTRGSLKPLVTIVEFSDFQCPFCNAVQPALKQILETYGKEVRLIFKHMPLEGHSNSLPAARAAYCAAEQDRFWQFHDALFAARDLAPPTLEKIANDLGLGMPKFQACVRSEHSRSAIIKDIDTARVFRIESTPSFLFNGKLIQGALSFGDFQKMIERELGRHTTQQPSLN